MYATAIFSAPRKLPFRATSWVYFNRCASPKYSVEDFGVSCSILIEFANSPSEIASFGLSSDSVPPTSDFILAFYPLPDDVCHQV